MLHIFIIGQKSCQTEPKPPNFDLKIQFLFLNSCQRTVCGLDLQKTIFLVTWGGKTKGHSKNGPKEVCKDHIKAKVL